MSDLGKHYLENAIGEFRLLKKQGERAMEQLADEEFFVTLDPESNSVAVIVKHELVLAIIGGLFVLEAVSVIVQVASFKLTGKRVFRMAPLHHHFEKMGWQEATIVIRFWIIAMILALVGLSTLKLR